MGRDAFPSPLPHQKTSLPVALRCGVALARSLRYVRVACASAERRTNETAERLKLAFPGTERTALGSSGIPANGHVVSAQRREMASPCGPGVVSDNSRVRTARATAATPPARPAVGHADGSSSHGETKRADHPGGRPASGFALLRGGECDSRSGVQANLYRREQGLCLVFR